MKKLLHSTYLLLAALCLSLAGVQSAYATHGQGGQLTYAYIPGTANQYRVTLRYFRDCSGSTASTAFTLTYSNTGCTGGQTISMPRVGALTPGSPYCPTTPGGASQCSSTSLTNYETATYEAVVTLPPANEWLLKVSECCRPEVANLSGSLSEDIYFEARLNNRITVNGTNFDVTNTSPQYQPQDIPIPFVCFKNTTTITFSATEPDGDSLVYSMDRPLGACNDPIPYQAILGGSVNAFCPGGGGTIQLPSIIAFNQAFPIPSYNITGNCPTLTATTQNFRFNTVGSFTITPAYYFPVTATSPTADKARNKYAVVGKVTEYRRLPGSNRRYLVGSVRREMLVIVIDCSGNLTPGNPIATAPPKTGATITNTDSTLIRAQTCNYSEVRVKFSDPNPTDLLTVTYPIEPGSTTGQIDQSILSVDVAPVFRIVGNGTATPYAIIGIKPDVSDLGKSFRIPVRIEDSGCPVKAVQNRIIIINIVSGQFARVVTNTTTPFVCANSPVTLTAAPMRPDSVLQRQANYGFRWTPAPGLALADTNKQNVVVRPLVTTRYRVKIIGLDFRQSPTITCFDTASILIRVAPSVLANFTHARINEGREHQPPHRYSFVNTSTRPATPSPQDSISYRWIVKYVQDSKGKEITEPEYVHSRQFTPAPLELKHGGEYRVTLRVSNQANGATCPPVEKTVTIYVPEQIIPNVFTPNNDGKNDEFILTTEQTDGGGKLQIFNRWGRLVKQYDNYKNEWKGEDQPAGVYYYLLTDKTGNTTKGWVELVR
ncbi:gliding motility-associated C-terminal domain-containing protein [Hymenobacter sp. BT175]|uniref:gliding motility-associated C-terminal domain-containing protein n=1 Tax=Hymenobacter translucens TaxID=2886507 RepID=UPI001D0EBECF|nr:gliding motility-associated C-terminal domain-containing protein [Hymenobacter translucens]MCC2548898.1 gliding motility-associated C-terminal domain-containing protein [Hymenobacter translucens]